MRFRFRLQRALDFAELREKKMQSQVAASAQRERVLSYYLDKTRTRVRLLLERLHADPGGPAGGYLGGQIEIDTQDVQRLTQSLEEERVAQARLKKELTRLTMRRKALEALRDRRRSEFRQAARRQEQKSMDEVSGQSWRVRTGAANADEDN